MEILYNLWDFLVVKNFDALATILTIGGAVYIYLLQKKEGKEQIASLLVNDIRNADDALNTLKESFNSEKKIPDVTVLPENNWKKFSYLLVKILIRIRQVHSTNTFLIWKGLTTLLLKTVISLSVTLIHVCLLYN